MPRAHSLTGFSGYLLYLVWHNFSAFPNSGCLVIGPVLNGEYELTTAFINLSQNHIRRGRKIVFPQGVHGVLFKEKPWPQDLQEDHEDLSSFWAAETSFGEVTVSEE